MQTFLPYPNFVMTAKILDYRRLGKQRVEAMQIIHSIEVGSRWSNHPASKMWGDYVSCLKHYHDVMITEWVARGYKNTMKKYNVTVDKIPPWLGDMDFHKSHQSNLVRKKPEYYRQFFPDIPDDLPYIWPV